MDDQSVVFNPSPSASPEAKEFPTDRTSSSHAAGPEGSFGLSLNTKAQTPKFVKRSSLVEDGSPKFRTSRKECSGAPTKAAHP